MTRTAAILSLSALAPFAASAEETDPTVLLENPAGPAAAACAPPPRPDDQVAYLSLIVGAGGLVDDDAFRLAEGAPCLTLRASED